MTELAHDPYYGDDDWYAWHDDEIEDWDEDDGDPCSRCGPHCQYWGGDGLCDLEIRALAAYDEFYEQNYVVKDSVCPACGAILTVYKVPSGLWQWPGDWLSPIIALGIYSAYDVPKGIIHQIEKDMYHVWIGAGENGRQCIVATNCARVDPDPGWLEAQIYGDEERDVV